MILKVVGNNPLMPRMLYSGVGESTAAELEGRPLRLMFGGGWSSRSMGNFRSGRIRKQLIGVKNNCFYDLLTMLLSIHIFPDFLYMTSKSGILLNIFFASDDTLVLMFTYR